MKTDLGRNLRIPCTAGLIFALLIIGFTGNIQLADAADTYEIDTAHSMILFRAKHNGITYNYGRFNEFTGEIAMGENVSKNMVTFEVKTAEC